MRRGYHSPRPRPGRPEDQSTVLSTRQKDPAHLARDSGQGRPLARLAGKSASELALVADVVTPGRRGSPDRERAPEEERDGHEPDHRGDRPLGHQPSTACRGRARVGGTVIRLRRRRFGPLSRFGRLGRLGAGGVFFCTIRHGGSVSEQDWRRLRRGWERAVSLSLRCSCSSSTPVKFTASTVTRRSGGALGE